MGFPTGILLLLAATVHLTDPQLPAMMGMSLSKPEVEDALALGNYLMRRPFGPKRVRRECRLISDKQLQGIFDAISAVKRDTRLKPNVLEVFSSLHSHPDINTAAHGGPGFLSWHRVYIYMFEILLRMYNPDISLCYWDNSLEPDNMADSVMWTHSMFGNTDGVVTTGFAGGWVTALGVLRRDGGTFGMPMTKKNLDNIFSKTTLGEISFPNGEIASNIEEFHNNIHVYVGGLMGKVETASYDPIFWFLHTYIDCLYEWFREQQLVNGTVNRELDWPLDGNGDENSEPLRPMRFGKLKMIDGANDWFSRNTVSCEKMIERCISDLQCGIHMRCNEMTGRCISDTVRPAHSNLYDTLMGKFGNLRQSLGTISNLQKIRNMFGGISIKNLPNLFHDNSDITTKEIPEDLPKSQSPRDMSKIEKHQLGFPDGVGPVQMKEKAGGSKAQTKESHHSGFTAGMPPVQMVQQRTTLETFLEGPQAGKIFHGGFGDKGSMNGGQMGENHNTRKSVGMPPVQMVQTRTTLESFFEGPQAGKILIGGFGGKAAANGGQMAKNDNPGSLFGMPPVQMVQTRTALETFFEGPQAGKIFHGSSDGNANVNGRQSRENQNLRPSVGMVPVQTKQREAFFAVNFSGGSVGQLESENEQMRAIHNTGFPTEMGSVIKLDAFSGIHKNEELLSKDFVGQKGITNEQARGHHHSGFPVGMDPVQMRQTGANMEAFSGRPGGLSQVARGRKRVGFSGGMNSFGRK